MITGINILLSSSSTFNNVVTIKFQLFLVHTKPIATVSTKVKCWPKWVYFCRSCFTTTKLPVTKVLTEEIFSISKNCQFVSS